jgi:LacI family transcriptional regulator
MVSKIHATRATLRDIARRAGVSTATASRVLNGSGRASAEAKVAIFAAANSLGYRRAAAIEKSFTRDEELVAVVWHLRTDYNSVTIDAAGGVDLGAPVAAANADPSSARRFGHSFFQDILNGILDELARHGRKAAVQTCQDLTDPAFLDDLNAPGHAGAIVFGEFPPELRRFADSCRIPLVFADQDVDFGPDVVTIDNVTGMIEAVDHLVAHGHSRIGFIGGMPDNPSFSQRHRSFVWRMLESGLQVRREWQAECGGEIDAAEKAVHSILERRSRPTALVCANDNFALAVYRAATALGLAIPRDLSVVGFDDIDLAALLSPPLTTVRVPAVQIGRLAVRQLLAQISTPRRPGERGSRTAIRTSFIPRGSTGPALRSNHATGKGRP